MQDGLVHGFKTTFLTETQDPICPIEDNFCLATVVEISPGSNTTIMAEWIQQHIASNEEDRIFDPAFYALIVFTGVNEEDVEFADEAREYLVKLGNERVIFTKQFDITPGPYALIGKELRDVWRLFEDSNGTCMATLQPLSKSGDMFTTFPMIKSNQQHLSFAIRSKIKSKAGYDSPTSGFRVVVKDNIHMKGIKTSVGNKAFDDTYPPRAENAECIQRLIDLGVEIVGKTKMSSFGNWEEPTEYIDYQAPWNPRGDSYQSTGGSSSGSAAAIAAYDWLDIAIGTDTWGSITRPALWCGCFGLRPSIGTVSTVGVEPYVKTWDIPGFLGRDLQKCRTFAEAWLDPAGLEKNPADFSSIMFPTDLWSIIDPAQVNLARQFVKKMEFQLGIKSYDVSFEEEWTKSSPTDADGMSLMDYINPATSALAYDVYHNCSDFRERYEDKFGRRPYTTAPNQRLWSFGKNISKEERDAGFKKIDNYSDWFRNSVLSGPRANALTVLPLESVTARYRDQPPTFKRPPQGGINALALAAVVKAPALAVPIGQIPYHSAVTDHEEKLPLVVAIMSRQGYDVALLDAMQKVLSGAGMPTTVLTGSEMFRDPSPISKGEIRL